MTRPHRLARRAAACTLALAAAPAIAQDALVADRPGFAFSTLTIAPGRVQVETSLGWESGDADGRYSTPTSVRIGLAPQWELRVTGSGYAYDTARAEGRGAWSDVALGFKRHLAASPWGASLGVIAQVDLATGRGSPNRGARPYLGMTAEWTLAGGRGFAIAQGLNLERAEDGARNAAASIGAMFAQPLDAKSRVYAELAVPRIALDGGEGHVVIAGIGAARVIGNETQIDITYSGGLTDEAADHAIAIGLARRW